MNSQLLFLVVIAMVAGVILFRLYSVLGRRTGHERPPRQLPLVGGAAKANTDNVVPLPAPQRSIEAQPSDPIAQGLAAIKQADRNFDKDHFVGGARHAYELVVIAFAAGDRATLKPLLSDEVYSAFDSGMKAREDRHEKTEFTFVGFKDLSIAHAEMKGRLAEITVSFQAQYISATKDANGEVVEGDPKTVRDVTDLWTFARDTRSSDPNWSLIATHGEA